MGGLVPVPSRHRATAAVAAAPQEDTVKGWYAKGSPPRDSLEGIAEHSQAVSPVAEPPLLSQVTRPQPVERSRQIILEWSRQPAGESTSDAVVPLTATLEQRAPLRMDAPLDGTVLRR
jgi:hypothetical protein